MGYFTATKSKFKKLKNRENGKYKENFRTELLKLNRARIRMLTPILAVIFIVFIIFIDIPRFQNNTLLESTGFIWIAVGRVFVFILSILTLVLSFLTKIKGQTNKNFLVSIFQKIVVSLMFLALMANAIGDYLILGSIETYIGISLAFAILIFMADGYSFLFFLLNYLLFIGVIDLLTPEESFMATTLFTNCFSFSLFSFAVSRINYYSALNTFHQKMIITEQKDKLEELSTIDQLTKVFNRRKFDDLISAEIDRANRYKHRFAVIMFDIDHFKKVNDTYGHHVGDSVLIEMSSIIKNNLRKTDSIIRWGGEEFIVLASETTLPNAAVLGEKLRKLVSTHNFPEVGQVTSSFGISEYIYSETADTMMKRVDSALYAAKDNGRNRVESL